MVTHSPVVTEGLDCKLITLLNENTGVITLFQILHNLFLRKLQMSFGTLNLRHHREIIENDIQHNPRVGLCIIEINIKSRHSCFDLNRNIKTNKAHFFIVTNNTIMLKYS